MPEEELVLNGLVFRLLKTDHPGETRAALGSRWLLWGALPCWLEALGTLCNRQCFGKTNDSFATAKGKASGKFVQTKPHSLHSDDHPLLPSPAPFTLC